MKYFDFKRKVQDYPFFGSWIFPLITDKPQVLRNQIKQWRAKGLVVELKRGMYSLSDSERNTGLSGMVLANNLCSPSYLSLEYALSYHGLIPEGVFEWTSITSKKTNRIRNQFGLFSYSSIRHNAFTGFSRYSDEYGFPYFLAEPEKALLDFFYFRFPAKDQFSPDIFQESYRLQNTDKLSQDKMNQYSTLYRNRKVKTLVALWLEVHS